MVGAVDQVYHEGDVSGLQATARLPQETRICANSHAQRWASYLYVSTHQNLLSCTTFVGSILCTVLR